MQTQMETESPEYINENNIELKVNVRVVDPIKFDENEPDTLPTGTYSDDIVKGRKSVFKRICCLCTNIADIILYLIALIVLIVMLLLFLIFCVLPSVFYACLGQCFCKSLANQILRFGNIYNWTVMFVRCKFGFFWSIIMGTPYINTLFYNLYTSFMVKSFAKKMPRIQTWNSKSKTNSISYNALIDESREYIGRVLPPNNEYTQKVSKININDVTSLFDRSVRGQFVPETNKNSTCLLPYYAQWFSHQLFNTNTKDRRKCNQPLGVNAGQLYGSTEEIENRLRLFKDGLLKSTFVNGKEFPLIIKNNDKTHFMKGKELFDIPIPIANMVPGFAVIHTLFFRHHQYVARTLKKYYPNLTDYDIFEKTKLIVLFTMIKITLLDYVGALKSSKPQFQFNPNIKSTICWKVIAPTNFQTTNTINIEFNILYRWHQFYPDKIKILKIGKNINELTKLQNTVDFNDEKEGKYCDIIDFPLNENWNSVQYLTQEYGVERLLLSASKQRAGKLTLLNTNKWLTEHVVKRGLIMCRDYKLDSLNAYRKHFGFKPFTKFEQITDDKIIIEKLKKVYNNDINLIEYYPGVFAATKDFNGSHAPYLAYTGVGFIFGGLYANRIWDNKYINDSMQSITPLGLQLINDIKGIKHLTVLHTELNNDAKISFELNRSTD